tara:strand:+ start:147 stop:1121 length:975 start_codon:yes stop_codon:yes gene_type:complete
MSSILDGKVVLVTGATGSFGRQFLKHALETDVEKLIVFSRDELKQYNLQQEHYGEERLRFFLGDVRDRDRVYRAFDGVDFVVHAAALKQIPAAEYNPFEFVKTNILGAQNIIDAAIDRGVEKVVALSTDKASSPINLYGATKLVSDKLFVAGNSYVGTHETRFGVVRYGNVLGSRGSVVPRFKALEAGEKCPITDERMTRFWITLDQGIRLVLHAFETMEGGETFVPKIPSMKMMDMATALAPEADIEFIGIRPGEKLHEEMISPNDARRTVDRGTHYVILPDIGKQDPKADKLGSPVPPGFHYSSEKNEDWLDHERLHGMLDG